MWSNATGAVIFKIYSTNEGHSVQIRCPYKSGYETHMKYLCRGECYTFQIKDIPLDSESAKDKRFSLNDDTAARVFTVTITDLRSEDGGKYWCATEQKVRDDYTEILLVVKVGEDWTIEANNSRVIGFIGVHTHTLLVGPI
uniref:Immunoglobulin domain-containing protein n=1 Tax=Electrophorus electricus TaxID=8005 RepID=A0AAY5F1P0_ELEEL